MTAARHLLHLLRGRWFRRLFTVRVASQLTDGVFQVALAAYVIFSPEKQATPAAIASHTPHGVRNTGQVMSS